MDPHKFPSISKELLEALEVLYPERQVMPGMMMDELMHYGGQRALIKWLREVHEGQLDTEPEETSPSLLDADQDEET